MANIELTGKITPKNDAFIGMMDAKQILGGEGNRLPESTLEYTSVGNEKSRVILRKNTDFASLQSQFTGKTNTIFEVRYEHSLFAGTLILPNNSTLDFKGGKIINGNLQGNNTECINANIENVAFVNNLFFNKSKLSFDSVSDLKNANSLVPNTLVETKGYYVKNDFGGATYNITYDNSLIEDLGSVFSLQNGLKAILIPTNWQVLATQFGAKPANFRSAFYDSTNNLQDALNYISKYDQFVLEKTNKTRKLIINSSFFTKELNLNGTATNITIEGYDAFTSSLTYCGENGYKGNNDFSNMELSYILKVSGSGTSFRVKNVGFYGTLNHNNYSNTKSIAYYGLLISKYYDWGDSIEGCCFSTFIESGLCFANTLLNGYLINNRFDAAGRAYIKLGGVMSCTISNYTMGTRFHNFGYIDQNIRNLFTGFNYMDLTNINSVILGNCFIEISWIGPGASLKIENARVEGDDFVSYDINKSSFIRILDTSQLQYDYKANIEINNHNFDLPKLNSLIYFDSTICTEVVKLTLNRVHCSESGISKFSFNNGTYVSKMYSGILTNPRVPQINFDYGVADQYQSTIVSSIKVNGMQLDVTGNISEKGSYFKYNDIVFNVNYEDGTNITDTHNCIGYSCIRPLKGYGINVPISRMPQPISGTIQDSSTIITSLGLIKGVSYTLVYNNSTTKDAHCTSSDLQSGVYVNKFLYDTLDHIGESVVVNITRCEWKPFGKKVLNIEKGTDLQKPLLPILNDEYYSTDSKRFEKYDGVNWIKLASTNEIEANIDNLQTSTSLNSLYPNVTIGTKIISNTYSVMYEKITSSKWRISNTI